MSFRQTFLLVGGIIFLVLFVAASGMLFENVPAESIVVIQSPISGELKWCVDQGLYWQGFGKVTYYRKSFQYWFSAKSDQGKKADQSIQIRFNDGGNGSISGSVRIDLPRDPIKLSLIHTRFGSQAALEHELIRTLFEKAVYMSGPMMSSAQSYAERRNQLIGYIEDQASRGIYQTKMRDIRGKDPITGAEKTITIVEVVHDAKSPSGIAREEESPLTYFGLKAYNLSINAINYDKVVEEQIATQQRAFMSVQTAMAEAKRAEQRKLTVEQEGAANAAQAKWEQEVIKAKFVTEAEQRLKVAEFDKQTASQRKAEQILLGEGESQRRQLLMAADNQLEIKLAAWKEVMFRFADQIGKQQWVPQIQMGGTGDKVAGGSAIELINLLTAKTAMDLGLNLQMPKGK
jgi:hypothetical protein